MSAHPEYARVFDLLEGRGIRACCLRDEIDGGTMVGDLDLLVDPGRFDDAVAALEADGFRVRAAGAAVPLKAALTKRSGGRFVTLDLHREVVQDGVVFLDAGEVLDRARRRDGHAVPAEDDLLVVLVVHDLVGKGAIPDKHREILGALRASVGADGVRRRLAGRACAAIVAEAVERLDDLREDPARADATARRLREALLREDRGARARLVRRRLARLARRCSPRPRGPLYAFVGPDGAGKSTLIANLLRDLGGPGGFPAVEIYMGPWGHYRLPTSLGEPYVPGWSLTTAEWLRALRRPPAAERPTLREVARRIAAATGAGPPDEDPGEAERVRNGSRIFLTLRWLRSVVGVMRFFGLLAAETALRHAAAYRLRRRGTVVLADRYPYDLVTGRMHETVPHHRRLRAAFCRLVPRPTRTFLLEADDVTILARKDDLGPETLARFVEAYDALARAYRFDRVRTDGPPGETASKVVDAVFDELCDRLRR